MSKNVFVSYRREDSAASAGRLGDRLVREFGEDRVFMDVDGIPLGIDFIKRLNEEVATCDVLLAIIGPQWADLRDENGDRRLDNPEDFVRVEIRAALQRDIPVVPILLDGTKPPKANSLPEDIRPLAVRNALDLRHASFQKDLDRLVRELGAVPSRRTAEAHTGWFFRSRHRYAAAALILVGAGSFLAYPRLLPQPGQSAAIQSVSPTSETLVPIPCEEEKNLRSQATVSSATIDFLNNGPKPRRIYWLNHMGARVRYAELASGQKVAMQTFVTHPWLISDPEDRCIGIYLPSSSPSSVLLN